jgi:hypothetical protein
MEDVIEYNKASSDDIERDWSANYTLSKEQVAQLILNKFKRATYYQRKEGNVFFDD